MSFLDICLDNLPEGNLAHRRISPREAKRCIERARKAKALQGVCPDIFAPYRKKECEDHQAVRRLLAKHFDIALSLEDFCIEADGIRTVAPLECAQPIHPDQVEAAQQRLETMLLAGLDSGDPIPVTAEFWGRTQRAFDERRKAAASERRPGSSAS